MDVEVEDWVDGGGHFHQKPIIIIITVLIAVIITGPYIIYILHHCHIRHRQGGRRKLPPVLTR